MARDWYKASAPGTLMLMGEHAVLHNKHALCVAINKRIEVELNPRSDDMISIQSDLGNFKTQVLLLKNQLNNKLKNEKLECEKLECENLKNEELKNEKLIEIGANFEFVLGVVKSFFDRDELRQGFNLTIKSEIVSTKGLGSSAAVVMATLAVFKEWLQNVKAVSGENIRAIEREKNDAATVRNKKTTENLSDFIISARNIVREIQGRASGTDVATSLLGGLVYYRADPLFFEKLNFFPPLFAIYSGYKTKTMEVIKRVEAHFRGRYDIRDKIFEALEDASLKAYHAILTENWEVLGKLMKIQQSLLANLGVSDQTLNDIIHSLNDDPKIYGAKISGSGLGDCVIGLGERPNYREDVVPFEISSLGLQYE